MPSTTIVLDPCLGSSLWSYIPLSKKSNATFSVSGVAVNKNQNFNLSFDHNFYSTALSDKVNTEIINDLTKTLKSVGAVNLDIGVVTLTPYFQNLYAVYTINNVPKNKVDDLCSTIANVCTGVADKLASLC